jgi:hypothetical protein
MYRRLRSTAHSVGAAIARTYGCSGLSAYLMWLGESEIAMGTMPAMSAGETVHQGGSHDVVPLTDNERSVWSSQFGLWKIRVSRHLTAARIPRESPGIRVRAWPVRLPPLCVCTESFDAVRAGQ